MSDERTVPFMTTVCRGVHSDLYHNQLRMLILQNVLSENQNETISLNVGRIFAVPNVCQILFETLRLLEITKIIEK